MSRDPLEHETLSTADIAAGAGRREMPRAAREADFRDEAAPHLQQPQPRRDEAGFDRPPQGWQEPQPQRLADDLPPVHDRHAGHPQGSRPDGGLNEPMEQLAALFPPQMAADFRARWDQVQIGFVDDPRQAVRQADELVAEVMKSLAAGFADQRSRLEAGLGDGDHADTENLRMALRSYRSFFQRLLSL